MRHACVRGGVIVAPPQALPSSWRDPGDRTTYTALHRWPAGDLAALGWLPVTENQPAFDPATQRLVEGAARVENGTPVVDWSVEQVVPLPTLAEVKERRRSAVDAKLVVMGEAGLPYGGKPLQLRESDQQNIIAMSVTAMLAQSGAIPWPAGFAWRMRDNSYLSLPTPADMIALAAFAMQEVKRLRFVAFGHKDAIDALGTVAAVEAYDIDRGWT